MKNFFAFLLYCASLAVVACDNDTVDTPDEWFRDPVVTVSGTTVEVKCLTLFGHGVLASASSCGFVCTPVSGDDATPPSLSPIPKSRTACSKRACRHLLPKPNTTFMPMSRSVPTA